MNRAGGDRYGQFLQHFLTPWRRGPASPCRDLPAPRQSGPWLAAPSDRLFLLVPRPMACLFCFIAEISAVPRCRWRCSTARSSPHRRWIADREHGDQPSAHPDLISSWPGSSASSSASPSALFNDGPQNRRADEGAACASFLSVAMITIAEIWRSASAGLEDLPGDNLALLRQRQAHWHW